MRLAKELPHRLGHVLNLLNGVRLLWLAEGEGFEPPVPGGTAVFKTAAFVHSATPPQ